MPTSRSRRVRKVLPLIFDLLLVVVLFALDIRDLHYKIGWIGPYDAFSFYAISFRTFDKKPAVLAKNFTANDIVVGDEVFNHTKRDSGWPSLLSNCDTFYPAGPFLFIGGMGINCKVGTPNNTVVIPKLYLSASVRADSMAWAGCKLLYRHRKPSICHEHIVTSFIERYGFQDRDVTPSQLALPFSDGETEVLNVLAVIAKSEPLTKITCVEAFAYDGPKVYHTHIYGCGGPNVYQSAFAGVHAPAFKDFHQDMAWLTADTINFMGFKYILRENVKSEFTAQLDAAGAVTLTPKSITNFSSSGALYNTMIVIDVILMIVHMWSAIEIARLMILPLLYAHLVGADDAKYDGLVDDYRDAFTSSLYRSRPIVLLMTATQLISWIIIIPNSIIFTWSTSSKMAKIQAYLSSLRLWVLILMLFNEAWDWVVMVHERFAYHVTRFTYIATYEILAIAAIVSYVMRKQIFAVSNTKYDMELQRSKDFTSYTKRMALTNAYNEALDFQLNTPTEVLWVLYEPLFQIVGWCMLFNVILLVVRYIYYRFAKPMIVRKFGDKYRVVATRLGMQIQETDPAAKKTSQESESEPLVDYKRLPLEDLLNDPIRARCLVRATYDIETVKFSSHTNRPERFIRPVFFLEHGVMVDRGCVRTRQGFFKCIEPKVKLDECLPAETSKALSAMETTLRQRKSIKPVVKATAPTNEDGDDNQHNE